MFIGQYIYQLAGDVAKSIKIFNCNPCCSISVVPYLFIYLFMYFLICKGGYVFGSVGLSVCLFVCLSKDNITQKSYERIGVKFIGGVLGSTMKN